MRAPGLPHGPRRPRRRRCSSAVRTSSTRATGIDARTDVLVRDGVDRRPRRRSRRAGRRRGRRRRRADAAARRSSIRTCTCARPGRSTRRTSRSGTAAAAAGGFGDDPRDAEHRPGRRLRLGHAGAARARGRRGGRRRRLPRRDLARPARRAARRARRRSPTPAPSGSRTTGGRSRASGLLRRAFQYASITGPRALAALRGALALTRGAAMHEGAVSARARDRRLPVDRRVA